MAPRSRRRSRSPRSRNVRSARWTRRSPPASSAHPTSWWTKSPSGAWIACPCSSSGSAPAAGDGGCALPAVVVVVAVAGVAIPDAVVALTMIVVALTRSVVALPAIIGLATVGHRPVHLTHGLDPMVQALLQRWILPACERHAVAREVGLRAELPAARADLDARGLVLDAVRHERRRVALQVHRLAAEVRLRVDHDPLAPIERLAIDHPHRLDAIVQARVEDGVLTRVKRHALAGEVGLGADVPGARAHDDARDGVLEIDVGQVGVALEGV